MYDNLAHASFLPQTRQDSAAIWPALRASLAAHQGPIGTRLAYPPIVQIARHAASRTLSGGGSSTKEDAMKLSLIGPSLATLLLVAGCGASSRRASAPERAAHEAEEEKQEAQEEAQEARRDAERARQEAREETREERAADQNAQWAAQRAAQAEIQAAQARREGITESQGNGAAYEPRIARGKVFFEVNSAELSPDARAKLDEMAKYLRGSSQRYHVIVEGYSDDTGTDSDNDRLSRRRAEEVATYLESRDIHSERITTKGLGSRNSDDTSRGRALNRRVEIVIEPAAR
jgi:OmpA-OmpF porin, OOP family